MHYSQLTAAYPQLGWTCLEGGGPSASRLIGRLVLIVILQVLAFSPPCSSEGEIRCYCNEAGCVSTGYMCKSSIGRCYSQLTYYGRDNTKSVHGCVESLPQPDKIMCGGQGDIVKTKNGASEWPILICCHEDMCNYMDSLDINIQVSGSSKSNGSTHKGGKITGSENTVEHKFTEEAYHDRELWFKAAVIAVPIAGGFILVLLVLLAVRMLRNDSRRHRQLLQMRRHRGLTKAQLYVADHFCDKADHHLCFNSLEKPQQTNINSVYKDVNIKVDLDGSGYERLKPCPHNNQVSSTTSSSSSPQKSVSDSSTKSSITLHTSSTQTPALGSSLVNTPCDSVILWAHPKDKDTDAGGEVV